MKVVFAYSGQFKRVACLLLSACLSVASHAGEILTSAPDTWSLPSNIMHKSLVQDLEMVGERIFLAGVRGHIAWSDDGGNTWSQAKVPTIQDISAIDFVTNELGWAVGQDGNIFNTTDGGKTWQMQLDGLAFNIVRARTKVLSIGEQLGPLQEELAQARADLKAAEEAGEEDLEDYEIAIEDLEFELDDLSFYARDARNVYKKENAPWSLLDVWFRDTNKGFAVGAFNAILTTDDGGKNWRDISDGIDNPDGFHLNSVVGYGSTVFVVGEAGIMYRSDDEGESWEPLESPDYGSFFSIYVEPQADSEELYVFITGLRGAVFQSYDSGNSWSKVDHDVSYNINSAYFSGEGLIIAVGNDGAVLRSQDRGQTFETHVRTNQLSLGSVVVTPKGDYLLAGAGGIQFMKPSEF